MVALEWPLPLVAGSPAHRSVRVRLAILPSFALLAVILYQGTNACLYYLVGAVLYLLAHREDEV
jgi:hypothetical protein